MTGFALGTSFGINNVIVPRGGPKCVPALLDFSTTGQIEIDGQYVVDTSQIEFIQGVFIDNRANATAFTLTCGGTGQVIQAAPNTQGYYALLAQTPPKLVAATTQLNARVVPLFFYNVPIQSQTWKAI